MAQQYYWHRFFSHQPDLNHNNPAVVKAVIQVMRFWLDLGVDGLRLDAIPYLCVREGTHNENLPETHAVIKQMRAVVDQHYHGRLFLAEANQWPEDVRDYFGDGDECHMAYHFPLMPRMYMAIAQEDRYPIVEILEQTPAIPDNGQWAVFLRNHDELTLEMVTDRERDYMYRTYAADPRMRVNVGIRRRLAPLMDNDPGKIKLMNSLLLSMPGTPIIYYGDEIGMGDNFYLGDRNGVRTPMQWSPDRNAGFSRADPQLLYLPPIMDPIYGYQAVNVEAQQREPASLLNWMKRLIAVRQSCKVFGRGRLEMLKPGNRKILAYVRVFGEETVLCVANLSRSAQPVELDLSGFKGLVPVEMLGQTAFPPISEMPYLLTLPRHGFYWFRLSRTAPPVWHEDKLPGLELRVLVLFHGWKSFFPELVEPGRREMAAALNERLVRQVLPEFLPTQRWFAGKGGRIEKVEFEKYDIWADQAEWLLVRVRVWLAGRSEPQDYGLPLALAWEQDGEEGLRTLWPYALAKIRVRARMGLLYDAFADERFCQTLLKMIALRRPDSAGARLVASSRRPAPSRNWPATPRNRCRPSGWRWTAATPPSPSASGCCSRVIAGLQPGINPELEMGRFLTEVAAFPNAAPLAGALEYEDEETGTVIALALLQGFVANQGDAWSYHPGLPETVPRRLSATAGDGSESRRERRTRSICCSPPPWAGAPANCTGRWRKRPAIRPSIRSRLRRPIWRTGWPGFGTKSASTLDRLEQARQAVAGTGAVAGRTACWRRRRHGAWRGAIGPILGASAGHEDPLPWRLSSRPGAGGQGRRDHHRLRGRAVAVAGGTTPQAFAAAGCGRHVALVQLCRACRPAPGCRRSRQRPGGALRRQLGDWEQQTRAAFLTGYAEAVRDSPGYPTDPDQAKALLELFTLEKACYELRYELDNRPDWVSIPLGGLCELLSLPTKEVPR